MSAERVFIRVFCGLGALVSTAGAWGAWEQHRRIATWREAPAEILESKSYVRHTRGGAETRTLIRYRYQVEGRAHESETVLPGPFPLGWAGTVEERLARFPAGAVVTARHHPHEPSRAYLIPSHSFVPYIVFLLGVPFFALAAGTATGGVRYQRSGETTPPPGGAPDGWWEVAVFRPWLAMRDASAGTWAILAFAGGVAYGHYFAVTVRPGPLGLLVFLLWLVLLVRLGWSVFKRTMVARSLDEARVLIRPRYPDPRAPFTVRVEQAAPAGAPRETRVRALEVSLVAERTVLRRRGRSKTHAVLRKEQVAAQDVTAWPGQPLRAETAFDVPGEVLEGEGYLAWRVEVRTRLRGPDYRTRFPIAPPPDEDED